MDISDDEVLRILEEVSEAKGVPTPELCFVSSNPSYASVFGSPFEDNASRIVIGRNLIDLMQSEDELYFVFAHELSHTRRDHNDEYDFGVPNVVIEMRADEGARKLMEKMGRSPCGAYANLSALDENAGRKMERRRLANAARMCNLYKEKQNNE